MMRSHNLPGIRRELANRCGQTPVPGTSGFPLATSVFLLCFPNIKLHSNTDSALSNCTCPTHPPPPPRLRSKSYLFIQPKGTGHLPRGRFFTGHWVASPAPRQRELEGTFWREERLGQKPGGVNDDRDRPERWGGRADAGRGGVSGSGRRGGQEGAAGIYVITPPMAHLWTVKGHISETHKRSV